MKIRMDGGQSKGQSIFLKTSAKHGMNSDGILKNWFLWLRSGSNKDAEQSDC